MTGQYTLIGIFLLIIGLAMAAMTTAYLKTRKLNLSWLFFGVFYTIGLLLLFTHNPIKNNLQIGSTDKFYSMFSLIILFVGIMLSYVICGKKGDKYIIAGILLTVGVHFIPFHNLYTYILAVGLIANASLVFIKKDISIFVILSFDVMMKTVLGIYLLLCL